MARRCEECGTEMHLIGYENKLICPRCGRWDEIDDEEKEDYDGTSDVSYCNVCEHSTEYPSCKRKCPYLD